MCWLVSATQFKSCCCGLYKFEGKNIKQTPSKVFFFFFASDHLVANSVGLVARYYY